MDNRKRRGKPNCRRCRGTGETVRVGTLLGRPHRADCPVCWPRYRLPVRPAAKA
jgi:hypothetical protein